MSGKIHNQPIVLIDDDHLIRMTWQFAAKKVGAKLYIYASPDEFTKEICQFSKATPIYIDSNLSDKIKGEIFAKELYQLGFIEIYLTTGYSPEQYENMFWIKSIMGKMPPFLS